MPSRDIERSTASEGRNLKAMVPAIVAVGLVAWFALTNFQDVEVNFWIVKTTAPLFVVIVLCVLLGLGIGYLAGRRGARRRSKD